MTIEITAASTGRRTKRYSRGADDFDVDDVSELGGGDAALIE
jgi:hypothetical protein